MGWIAAALAASLLAPPRARADEPRPTEMLARGKAHLAAGLPDDAAPIFRELALKSPDEAAGRESVLLYLRALNDAGSHPEEPRASAFAEMERDAPILSTIYCEPGRLEVNSEPCLELVRVRRELARFHARGRAFKAGPAEIEVAGVELGFWSEVGAVLCEKSLAGCEEMAKAAFAASNALEQNGRLREARKARRALRDPRHHLETLPLYKKLLFDAAAELQDAALFEEAATAYEQLAEEALDIDEAPRALERAVMLRIALGQAAEARRDARQFTKRFAASHPAIHWQISIALARLAAHRLEWKEVRAGLLRVIAPIDRLARADSRVLAHVWLARASTNLDDGAGAARHYESVRRAWKSPDEALREMTSERGFEARAAEVLEAVGEAVFFFAEQRRADVERIPRPVYKGPLRRQPVVDYVATRLRPFIARRTKAIEAAAMAYEEVFQIRPVAPPRWVVASAANVGSMWAELAKDFLRIPRVPIEIPPGSGLTEKEIRAAYEALTGGPSDSPPMVRAREVFTMCFNTAAKYSIADESTRRCEAWLAEHGRPPRIVPVDELYPLPALASSSFAPSPAAPADPTP